MLDRDQVSKETLERVEAFRMSLALFCVYIVLDADRVTGEPNTNYFRWGSYDIDGMYAELEEGRMPEADFTYVTVTSRKDPGNRRMAPEGMTSLQIMTMVPREYAMWNAEQGPATVGNAYHRDPKYRDAKEELTERLIASADAMVPGLGEQIFWKESASPLTQERFTRSTAGTSYGIEFAVDQMGPMRLGPRTEIEGLFLTGASTPSGHGIGSVMRGGVATAGAILGTNLMARASAGEIFGDPGLVPEDDGDFDPWEVCRASRRPKAA
jgi:all-trans-retinol 13,14-reductase